MKPTNQQSSDSGKEQNALAQPLAICEVHDQDPVIVISNSNEADNSTEETKVELKSCCRNASENALKRIHHALASIDYLEKNGTPEQEKPITILEVPVTDTEDIQIIKAEAHDYRLIWYAFSLHHMPPGGARFRS